MYKAEVIDISHKGLGVVEHSDGRKLFVSGVMPGDFIEYEVLELKKRFGFAKLLEVITPSAQRVEAACEYHGFSPGQCGGCNWMFISPAEQLNLKQNLIQTQINRAGLIVEALQPIHPSNQNLGYRNRAQLKTDGKDLGFVSSESKTLAPIQHCLVLNEKCNETVKKLNSKLPNKNWAPAGKFKWNYFEIDDQLEFSDLQMNKKLNFRQANTEQNDYMKNWLRTKLHRLSKDSEVLELFCGNGNFTQCLTEFKTVSAYEYSRDSIEQIKLKLPSVNAYAIDLYQKKYWSKINTKDVEILILDPPREGFFDLSEFINGCKNLKTIIYISCDPSTWAKDIKALDPNVWFIKEVQPVDQFPQTSHVELLSVISSKN